MEYLYDAFISYRHQPVEKAVAKKLEELLVRKKKKDGTRLSVFRDQSELHAVPDLDATIRKKLEQSRFLIILCSRGYLESEWCLSELEYFRQYHGGNDRILTILVEGEPRDVVPDVLRYTMREELDAEGNPVLVRVKSEPLSADVRGDSDKARMKKLRVEYMRIAAPLLGVDFDQLYRREQRKKLAVALAVIGALVAFSIYSVALIAQITKGHKQLEAKQQELYQTESVRLANEALELAPDNPLLAMMLVDAALPDDLAVPEFPLTEEAELSVRSVALQHKLEEEMEPFVLRTKISFDNDRWTLGRFYEEGKYFTVHDWSQTWLFEAQTGELIITLPGYECYFFDGMNRYVNKITTVAEDGTYRIGYVVGYTFTGTELGRCEDLALDTEYPYPIYDAESDRLWIADIHYLDTGIKYHFAYGWFDADGSFHEEDTLPIHLELVDKQEFGSMDYKYVAADGDTVAEYEVFLDELPEDYQRVVDAFTQQLLAIPGNEETHLNYVRKISKAKDGSLYLMLYSSQANGRSGTAFWAAEENCLLWTDKYWCFQEENTQRIYRMLDDTIEIYEVEPENFDVAQTPPVFDHVSENGVYGFAEQVTKWDSKERVALFAYDTSRLKDVCYEGVYFHRNGEYYFDEQIAEKGDYSYLTLCGEYDVTSDGTKLVAFTVADEFAVYDVEQETIIQWIKMPDARIWNLAISDDGSMVAYTKHTSNVDEVYLMDLKDPDNVCIISIDYEAYMENAEDGIDLKYLEISSNSLLLGSDSRALVYDLEDLTRKPLAIDVQHPFYECAAASSTVSFTNDGLLIFSGNDQWPQGNQERVLAIYDLNAGKRVNFYTTNDYHCEYYYYDDVGGNLVMSFYNEFVVQRRGENGDFEKVYSITPRHSNMDLITAGHSGDGTWLVLQNAEYCEIYRLEDGALCYMVRKPDDRSSQMAVINGRLYDFCVGWDRSILLPTTEEARAYIRENLVNEDYVRKLTEKEADAYYVPADWRAS